MTPASPRILRGMTLRFEDDPFSVPAEDSLSFDSDGAVVLADGKIAETGTAGDILTRYPETPIDHFPDHLILAGFVDAHVHYPQTGIIASFGEQLLTWLERYTFPAEAAFVDADLAAREATFFLDECLRNGITTAAVYGTVHPQSVDALFTDSSRRNMRMAAGKVMMDRNAPPNLLDTAETGYADSKQLIERWHGKGRNVYAITPRFAPTSTPVQLEAAGTLWREFPTTLMQTHLSENYDEIRWVAELFPENSDYVGVYERYGLVGKGANFGHGIHLRPREIAALRESGSGISHCPTSNAFIGSGLFDMAAMREGDAPLLVGLGTDVGGGSSYSMFDTMKSAYEIAQFRGYSLHPIKAFYLATCGGAALLGMEGKVGNLAPGYEADIQVIDPRSTPLIAKRMARSDSISDLLFTQMILADDRAIRQVYIAGEPTLNP
ncbi:MAG: guanine deaminase [Magnetospiraceae bacterium]